MEKEGGGTDLIFIMDENQRHIVDEVTLSTVTEVGIEEKGRMDVVMENIQSTRKEESRRSPISLSFPVRLPMKEIV